MSLSVSDNIRFVFLYADCYSMGSTWVYPESRIPYSMFRYIARGKAEFRMNGEPVVVKEGQIVYIPCGCTLFCQTLSQPFEFFSVRFTTSVFYDREDLLKDYYRIAKVSENQGEDVYFKEIYRCAKTAHPAKKCFLRGYLELLIGSLSFREEAMVPRMLEIQAEHYDLEEIRRREKALRRTVDPRIQIVADYVSLHPTERYTPERMAGMAELSKQRLSSLFKSNIGKTPMEYVREIRLTAAARQLLVSTDNISDIAYELGYESSNYFIREFKKAFGFTPNQYRKNGREGG